MQVFSRHATRPTTQMGRLAARFMMVALVVFACAVGTALAFGVNDGESDDATRFLGPIFGISLLIAGFGALVTAAVAVFRDHERSLLGWAALAVGVIAAIFMIGELLLPH